MNIKKDNIEETTLMHKQQQKIEINQIKPNNIKG